MSEAHRITTLVELIPSEKDFDTWDPSITVTDGPGQDSVRLMNDLCDALARNGYWWDRQGWVHRA